MKYSDQIMKWGKIKPYFDKTYDFNSLDIETIDNKMFILGFTQNDIYEHYTQDFYEHLHDFMIHSLQHRKDILTWSRYDNTHLLKLILSKANKRDINHMLLKVGKVSPIYTYRYKTFTIDIDTIIKDSMIFKIHDEQGNSRNLVIYNLKNLYDTDLLTTSKNYGLDYYSKLGEEFHIIDKKRFKEDPNYHDQVILSNELDNRVLIDIAKCMLRDFKQIAGVYPKSIFTNGSLARSYLLSQLGTIKSNELNFNVRFKGKYKKELLDYAMRSYHGGKIESYVLGFIKEAKIIDITSAYPYAMSKLPALTNKIIYGKDEKVLSYFFYAFIKCKINIDDPNLIHPVIVENPINKSNISPYGEFETVITKISYDYLIAHGCHVEIIDFYAVHHDDSRFPYREIVEPLFKERLRYKKSNPSLSQMYKIILNSLYGITYELTDMYAEFFDRIDWIGYRAGDFFNPIIASYTTDFTRTYLSDVSNHIQDQGGEVFLNMTDSIIFNGDVKLDVFSQDKVLGKFEMPTKIKNVYILGAGRYEYQDDFNGKYTIKSRGFSVSVKDKSFYSQYDLSDKISLPHRTFVTSFKATTKKYNYENMGYLVDDTYEINPFNLGGKRIIQNKDVNLNKEYTKTLPIKLERGLNL